MPTVRVATFNISGGVDSDRRFYCKRGSTDCSERAHVARETLDSIVALLQEQQVEITALQEVDVCYSGKDTLHQADYLAKHLAANVAYEPLFDYHLGTLVNVTTGLATCSKVALTSQIPLPFALVPEQRGGRVSWKRRVRSRILGAKHALHTIHEVEGEPLHVVNAHLSHNMDEQKYSEFSSLLEYCSQLDPVVLLGDLNTTPLSTRGPTMVEPQHFETDACMSILARYQREYKHHMHLDARLHSPSVQPICTYPSTAPSLKLDYCIGFSSKPGFSLSAETILATSLSNHCVVVVNVGW